MGGRLSKRNEELVQELGRHIADFQVLIRRQKGHLYHECHREPEQRLPPSKQAEKRIPKRYSAPEGTVSGNT